jgi:Tol biopolymer transport system component
MKRTLLLLLCIAAAVPLTATGIPVAERFDRAHFAWDAGDYVPALEGFKSVLTAPDGDAYFERIALATGELHKVTELTTDGRQPRFSPDGRYLSYETGSPGVTKIVDIASAPRVVADLHGTGGVFSPAGDRLAYFRLKPDAELTSARTALDQLQGLANPDRQKVTELQRQITRASAKQSEIVVRDLKDGREQKLADGGLLKGQLAWSGDGREVYFVGTAEQDAKSNDLYLTSESLSQPRAVTTGAGFKASPVVAKGGRYLLYTAAATSPFPAPAAAAGGGRQGGPGGGASRQFALVSVADGTTTMFTGSSAEFSADGSTLVLVSQSGTDYAVQILKPGTKADPVVVKKSQDRIASASLSPDGSRVAFDMPFAASRNTEIFCVKSDGTGEVRVSREIQPDRAPRFLTNSTLVAIKGESRHSRSYLYDLNTLKNQRLFHNNTIRTIAPEYEWVPSSDGRHLLIVAERDGDTISPERGVYLLDLGSRISKQDLLRRLDQDLAAERGLRQRGAAMFQPIAAAVRSAVGKVSMTKLYEYQEALFNFDSKYIGLPGNQKAADYLVDTFKGFGYTPELQWFTTRDRTGGGEIRTANVLATLKGTTNPELVYVLSSHFDSVLRGPGADDNSTGIAVLLEASRILSTTPMPATVIFAAFTGEEAGDLGSHEFVRQAVAKKIRLMGVLNNDMIGWTNDQHLDNTIRYSNAGIRDLQHAASFLFSKMVTYDAKYYKSTDAAAFYDDYGDIVGGLGSYPVLGNPYYHQPTDLLETVNQQLVFEATKMNIASLMELASSPARLTGVRAERATTGPLNVSWTPSPEKGVAKYIVAFGPPGQPMAHTLTVTTAHAQLPVSSGAVHVAVKAVNARGLASWDWAATAVPARKPSN